MNAETGRWRRIRFSASSTLSELDTRTPFGYGSDLAEEMCVRHCTFHKIARCARWDAIGQTINTHVTIDSVDSNEFRVAGITSRPFTAIRTRHLDQRDILFKIEASFNFSFGGLCFEYTPFVLVVLGTVSILGEFTGCGSCGGCCSGWCGPFALGWSLLHKFSKKELRRCDTDFKQIF